MASYDYQYDSTARKKEPEVKTRKKLPKKSISKIKQNNKNKANKSKNKEAIVARTNFAILMVIILGSTLLLMYRNVKIRESFAGVQALSKEVTRIEKENSQIAVNIQNNLNLNNIESVASSSLGMQKLSSKQTIYINLDTKDYTEITQKSITKEDKTNIIQDAINWVKDFF